MRFLTPKEAFYVQLAFQRNANTILLQRRADYADIEVGDPFKNFRFSDLIWNVKTEAGVGIRWTDKLVRFANLVTTQTGQCHSLDDPLPDAVRDNINYSVIAFSMWAEKHDWEILEQLIRDGQAVAQAWGYEKGDTP